MRGKNNRAECQAQALSASSSSQLVNWWFSPDQHLYSKLGHGSCIKKSRWVFHSILFYVPRAWLWVCWEYFHWSPPSSEYICQGASGGQIDWSSKTQRDTKSQAALSVWPCWLSGEFVTTCYSPQRTSVVLVFVALLFLEKSYSCPAYLVSQISGAVTWGIHAFTGNWRHHFHCTILAARSNEGLYFLRLTLEVNFLDLVRSTYSLVSCLLCLWLSHKNKGLLVRVTIWNWYEILLVNGQMMIGYIWKEILERSHN